MKRFISLVLILGMIVSMNSTAISFAATNSYSKDFFEIRDSEGNLIEQYTKLDDQYVYFRKKGDTVINIGITVNSSISESRVAYAYDDGTGMISYDNFIISEKIKSKAKLRKLNEMNIKETLIDFTTKIINSEIKGNKEKKESFLVPNTKENSVSSRSYSSNETYIRNYWYGKGESEYNDIYLSSKTTQGVYAELRGDSWFTISKSNDWPIAAKTSIFVVATIIGLSTEGVLLVIIGGWQVVDGVKTLAKSITVEKWYGRVDGRKRVMIYGQGYYQSAKIRGANFYFGDGDPDDVNVYDYTDYNEYNNNSLILDKGLNIFF